MTLKQYIKQTYKEGQIFSFKDLPESFRKPSSVVQLSRFVKAQEIGKLMRGVYYVPSKGDIFDKLPPSPSAVDVFVCKKYKGYLSGDGVFNLMGLTEQVPVTKQVFCLSPSAPIYLVGGRYSFKKAYLSPRGKDILALQILDALNEPFIAGTTRDQVDERITPVIMALDKSRKEKVLLYSTAYPQKTRERLLSLL